MDRSKQCLTVPSPLSLSLSPPLTDGRVANPKRLTLVHTAMYIDSWHIIHHQCHQRPGTTRKKLETAVSRSSRAHGRGCHDMYYMAVAFDHTP